MTNEEYGRYVDALAPRSKTGKNLLNAFWVGGLICAIGQALLNGYQALGLGGGGVGVGVGVWGVCGVGFFWGWGLAGADHGLCQRRRGPGHRVPDG